MSHSTKKLPKSLEKQGIFTFKQAREASLTQKDLARLIEAGTVERVRHGVYELINKPLDLSTRDFAIACLKFGNQAVIGGLSALFHYGLAEEVPNQVWVLVPPSKYSTVKPFRLIRTKLDLSIGVESYHDYRITSLERTIVDGFVFSSKIGEKIAYRAALRAIKEKRTTATKIFALADKLGVTKRLAKYSQVLFGGLEA